MDTDTEIYEIHVPTYIYTGANGVATQKSVQVHNQSEYPVIILNQGDTFLLETFKYGGGMNGDVKGCLGANVSGERAQREKESEISKYLLLRNGRQKIHFHGQQNTNYLSLGFKLNGKYLMFALKQPVGAGSKILVKGFPKESNAFIEEITLDCQGAGGLQTEYAVEFAKDIRLEWTDQRREAANQFYQEHAPSSMDDVIENGLWDKFREAMKIPRELETRVNKWKKQYSGCKEFFREIGVDDPAERLEAANKFMAQQKFHTLQEVVDEGQTRAFLDAIECATLKRGQRNAAAKYFEKFKENRFQSQGSRMFMEAKEQILKSQARRRSIKVSPSIFNPGSLCGGTGPMVHEDMDWGIPPSKDLAPLRSFERLDTFDFEDNWDTMRAQRCNDKMFWYDVDYEEEDERKREINEVLCISVQGELQRFIIILKKKQQWRARCDECMCELELGPNWYHKKGDSTEDRCHQHWSQISNGSEFVNFQDEATTEKFEEDYPLSCLRKNYFEDDEPPISQVEPPENWDDDQTQKFEASCRKANVKWTPWNDDKEGLENYLESKV